jgi:hypothetical protein
MSAATVPPSTLPINREEGPEPQIAGCVFVHVPRTAGSSIWQSLVRLAAEHQIRVFDIYRESNHRYGIPEASDRVLKESVPLLTEQRYFFHHHTAENIFERFKPGESVWATEPDSPFALHTARYWSPRFTSALRRDDAEPRELLDLGAAEGFFRNYYVNFFAALCWSEADAGKTSDISKNYKPRDLAELGEEVRQRFQIIGDFASLQESYSRIQAAFGIPQPPHQLALTINRGDSKPMLSGSERRRYVTAFSADYYLLEELGGLTSIHKSLRRAWRAVQSMRSDRRAA